MGGVGMPHPFPWDFCSHMGWYQSTQPLLHPIAASVCPWLEQ